MDDELSTSITGYSSSDPITSSNADGRVRDPAISAMFGVKSKEKVRRRTRKSGDELRSVAFFVNL
ncbi:hypothetical protein HDU97_005405, partial [Phlyctochytrium planicorne]